MLRGLALGSTGSRLAAVLLLCGLSAGNAHAGDSAIQVITHPQYRDVDLDRNYVRALFIQRVRDWPDGTPVRLFIMDEHSAEHGQFAREVLGTYPYVLRNVWERAIFTGAGVSPTVVASEHEMRQKVATTPGAIGYVVNASPGRKR